jgi:hypothetical protein
LGENGAELEEEEEEEARRRREWEEKQGQESGLN